MKIGDRVKIKESSKYYGQNYGVGTITKEAEYFDWIVIFDDGDTNSYRESDLLIIGGSMDDLKVGDILIDDDGDERYVMGVAGKIVWLSDDGNEADNDNNVVSYTVKELINAGFHLKGEEPEEMTMAEVCKELGRTIKIKK